MGYRHRMRLVMTVLDSRYKYFKAKMPAMSSLRDQSLLMMGRGPEDIFIATETF